MVLVVVAVSSERGTPVFRPRANQSTASELKAQGPSTPWNERQEEEERGGNKSKRFQGLSLKAQATTPGRENNLQGFKDLRLKNGSRQGRNLALNGLCVPTSWWRGGSIVTSASMSFDSKRSSPVKKYYTYVQIQ